MEQLAALMRFYLHINPDELDDDQFAKEWARLKWVLKQTGQME